MKKALIFILILALSVQSTMVFANVPNLSVWTGTDGVHGWFDLENVGEPMLPNGAWQYYYDEWGDPQWIKNGEEWYVLKKDGSFAKDVWVEYGDGWYALDNDGMMIKDIKINAYVYGLVYFDNNGKAWSPNGEPLDPIRYFYG